MSSEGSENKPNLQIIGQYIKDLSFENPGAPTMLGSTPEMELGVDVRTQPVGPEYHEVVLSMRIRASAESKPMFLAELSYATLVRMVNVPEDVSQRMLMIQVPHLMFPFARRILADVVRDGGLPSLMLEPIDFTALYQVKMVQAGQAAPPPASV